MKTQKESKIDKVKNYLLKHKSITSWQAITMFRVTRLAAVIHYLKKEGWEISTELKKTDEGNIYAKYTYLGEILV